MSVRSRVVTVLIVLLGATGVSPAAGQIEDQLSSYTGRNAEGYLKPLADAFGADLNSGLFHSAHIPRSGVTLTLEFPIMAVFFGDDDRTFSATTEGNFTPEQTTSAPTVVGSGEVKLVTGDGGTRFAFPGGFNLHSFALAVPQLRIGCFMGTQALIRYIAFNIGDEELGDISLFGFGLRHSISQYLSPAFPVELTGGFFWQSLNIGENQQGKSLLSSSAFSIGVQASRRFVVIEPYAGLSLDRHSLDVAYTSEVAGSTLDIDLDFEPTTTLHLTLGLCLNLTYFKAYIDYNVASQSSMSFGGVLGI
jgi:hypothetical protein